MSDYLILDVSHWEDNINWLGVDPRPDAVYLKATEGDFYLDPVFYKYRDALKALGIKWGAYHYFWPSLSASDQLDLFLAATDGDFGDLPPVLDFEPFGEQVASRSVTVDRLSNWLLWCENRTGQRPMIYTSRNYWLQALDLFGRPPSWTKNYKLWVAWYPYDPENTTDVPPDRMPKGWDAWDLWQYATDYTSPGLGGDYCDINRISDEFAAEIFGDDDMNDTEKAYIMNELVLAQAHIADAITALEKVDTTPPPEPPDPGEPVLWQAQCTTYGLNIRPAPGADPVLGVMVLNDIVDVYEVDGDWWRHGGVKVLNTGQPDPNKPAGWSHSGYLKKL